MMKLILSLTLIWALSSTAGALQCLRCRDSQCSSTTLVTCPPETMCVTASIRATSSGTTTEIIVKLCAPPSLCPATGAQTSSTNFGDRNQIGNLKCCDTDNCNSDTLSVPDPPTDNGLWCYSCTDSLDAECTTPIQCQGIQDRCLQMTVMEGTTTTSTFGCLSENLCAGFTNQTGIVGNVTTEASCCNTSLCNTVSPATTAATTQSNAAHVRLAVIHLLLALLIFTLC